MGRCRVVAPAVVRLPLSDGDWLDVKRELNAGEYSDLLTDLVARKPFSKILQYVLGWSLTGFNDEVLAWELDGDPELRRATVRSLDKGTLRELTAALDRHEAAEEAAIAGKKTTRAASPASSPPSASAAP